MASGLDLALPLELYFSRPVTWQTRFLKTGLLLGVVPLGALVTNHQFLITESFGPGPGLILLFSYNRDLSAPVATADISGAIGLGGAVFLTPEVNALKVGPIYFGIPAAGNVGAANISVRFTPNAAGGF